MMLMTFFKGLATGSTLIIAIGAQNAFVLNHGLRKNHVFVIPLICSLCDAALITIGVSGVGALIASNDTFQHIAALGGAAFLIWYGASAFISAFKGSSLEHDGNKDSSLKAPVLTTLAITLLNPHVYLDTMVLMGTIGSQFQDNVRPAFGAGAVTASFIWFFALSLGARFLAPLFKKEISWRILDTLIGITMWAIALSLIINLIYFQ